LRERRLREEILDCNFVVLKREVSRDINSVVRRAKAENLGVGKRFLDPLKE